MSEHDTGTEPAVGEFDDGGDGSAAREQLLAEREAIDGATTLVEGGMAIDLATRQPLFIRQRVADDLVEYYDAEGFDLFNYKMHPYLPVSIDDPVYECVFVPRSVEDAHSIGKTYDFPAGRLMHVPVEQAWLGGGD